MTLDASNESPSSGRGPRQIYCPRRLLLATFAGTPTVGSKQVAFRVETPDCRLHWKFSVIGINEGGPGSALLASRGLKIWVAALEDDNVIGFRGTPVTDIEGTSAAPTNFPSDPTGAYDTGLGGYSLENDGASADAIQGVITIPAQGGGPVGSLYLQARYQPNVQNLLPWDQWDEIRAACGISLLSERVDS
jgi:hypothetical protein